LQSIKQGVSMDLVRVTNGNPQRYSYEQFKRDNPLTSWPERAIESVLAPHGVFPLRSSKPTHDPARQVVKEGDIALVGSSWVRQWVVSDLPIEDIRAGMTLDRGQFCLALAGADILPPAEAIDAAKGNWPATFDAALASLSDAEKFAAQIEWATAQNVQRTHPLIAMLAAAANLSDAQVDTMFGIGEA
jgi:hypothetical protein